MCPFKDLTGQQKEGEIRSGGWPSSWLALLPAAAAGLLALGGLVGLCGWWFSFPTPANFFSLRPDVAVVCVFAALSLWLLHRHSSVPRKMSGRFFGGLVAGIGFLAVVRAGTHWRIGLNELFRFLPEGRAPVPPGMSLLTGLNFFLAGCALVLLDVQKGKGHRPSHFITLIVAAIAALALLGYVYQVRSLYHPGDYGFLALYIPLLFFVFSAGVLAARPDSALIQLVTADAVGSIMLRRLLPAVIALLVVLSWLRLAAQRSGLFESQVGTTLMVVLNILLFSALVFALAISLNRTDLRRKQAETTLRRSEEKFRGLLEAAPDPMVIVDQQGRIVLINSQLENLFGYNSAELEGMSIEILMPKRFREQHVHHRDDFFGHAHSRPMGAGLELFGLHKSGREFPVEISLSPLQTEEGLLVTSAIRDVTERKQFERELREASRMKSEFLANMSHELRTPLNGIIGFSEFLVDEKPGKLNAKQSEYLHDVLNSGRHLLSMINDVLDLAKVEAGKMEICPESFELSRVVEEVCATLKSIAQTKQITLSTNLSPAIGQVTLDIQRFRQVLYNLLSNALKFTNAGGSVEILSTLCGPNQFALQVKDTGIGIKPGDLGRLFRQFGQLESGAGREYGGTGLGLVLTKRIVELHRGSISVESELGKGSTFSAIFPWSNGNSKQN